MAISEILREFLSKRPPAPAAPSGFSSVAPQADAPDMLAIEQEGEAIARMVGLTFIVDYTDAAGEISRRVVTTRTISRATDGTILIDALCHLRGRHRRFRFDRMKAIVDPTTGEVYAPPHTFFEARGVSLGAKGGATEDLLRGAFAPVQLMIYFARIDGQFNDSEVSIVLDYLRQRAQVNGVQWGVVERFTRALYPDRENFVQALAAVTQWTAKERGNVERALIAIMRADGIATEDERDLLDEVSDALA